jgi:MFS family permease
VGTAAKYFVGISVAGLLGRALFSVLPAMIGRVWSGRLLGFAIAVTLGAAALLHDAFVGPLPWFVVMLALGAIFYDGGYCTLAPYATEVFPTRLAARGSGLAQSANGLGKIIGPLCLALIAGSNDLVSAKATEAAIQPAFLFLAACGAMLGLAFARLLFAHSLIAAAMAAKQLADSDRRFVRNCPLPHVESVKGMRCNVCHGTPKQIGQSPWHAAKPRPPSAT